MDLSELWSVVNQSGMVPQILQKRWITMFIGQWTAILNI